MTTREGGAHTPISVVIGDSRRALELAVFLDLAVRLLIWSKAIVFTCVAFTALDRWPKASLIGADFWAAWSWGNRLVEWVLLFNLIYVAELIVLRLLVPTPREGRYPIMPGRRVNRQVLWSCFVAVLTKARYQAPFPGFLVFHVANLWPMRWLMAFLFGPRSRSCNFIEADIIDPHLVTIGKNVVLGLHAVITGHYQERDAVTFKRTIIEDNVVVGGMCSILGGSHLKSGCVIGAHALVLPGTVVGPNEFWGGVPACKIRDLPPLGQPATEPPPEIATPAVAVAGQP